MSPCLWVSNAPWFPKPLVRWRMLYNVISWNTAVISWNTAVPSKKLCGPLICYTGNDQFGRDNSSCQIAERGIQHLCLTRPIFRSAWSYTHECIALRLLPSCRQPRITCQAYCLPNRPRYTRTFPSPFFKTMGHSVKIRNAGNSFLLWIPVWPKPSRFRFYFLQNSFALEGEVVLRKSQKLESLKLICKTVL